MEQINCFCIWLQQVYEKPWWRLHCSYANRIPFLCIYLKESDLPFMSAKCKFLCLLALSNKQYIKKKTYKCIFSVIRCHVLNACNSYSQPRMIFKQAANLTFSIWIVCLMFINKDRWLSLQESVCLCSFMDLVHMRLSGIGLFMQYASKFKATVHVNSLLYRYVKETIY